MREHRRKAVDIEQKLFETRREKYSNLLLKVMDIMDRFQVHDNFVHTCTCRRTSLKKYFPRNIEYIPIGGITY
jgi:hypothetical protein